MTLYSAILLGIHQMVSEWYYDDSHYRRAVVLRGLQCLSDFTQLLKRETLIYFTLIRLLFSRKPPCEQNLFCGRIAQPKTLAWYGNIDRQQDVCFQCWVFSNKTSVSPAMWAILELVQCWHHAFLPNSWISACKHNEKKKKRKKIPDQGWWYTLFLYLNV